MWWLVSACVFVIDNPLGGFDADTVEQERLVGPFDEVDNRGRVPVTVTDGPAVQVRVSCPADLIDQLVTETEGQVLVIDTPALSIGSWQSCAVQIATPRLVGVTGSGSGGTTATGAWPELAFVSGSGEGAVLVEGTGAAVATVTHTGVGDLSVSGIDTAAVEVFADGLGDVSVTGTADTAALSISDAGSLDALPLVTAHADITLSGSGDLAATVTDYAVVTLTGSGDVRVAGDGDVEIHDAGSGNVIVL